MVQLNFTELPKAKILTREIVAVRENAKILPSEDFPLYSMLSTSTKL